MNNRKNALLNEKGAALVLALLVMMALAILSMAAVNATSTGLTDTSRYKNYQQRLYMADGGADYGFAIIERTIGNDMQISATDTSNVMAYDLISEIMGDSIDDADTAQSANDAIIAIMGNIVNLDIDFHESKQLPGTSSEFASRYEGIGAGGAGGVELVYIIDSYFASTSGEDSTVRISYRCIEGGGRCL